MKKNIIENLKESLNSDDVLDRMWANTSILAYDLGRSNSEEEQINARKEWEFRGWAYECQYGLKEGLKTFNKLKSRKVY